MAGLIDTGINYRKQANAAFGQVAKNAAEIANANRKLSAAEKAGKLNAAGQGLGMGYMAYESGLLGKGAEKLGMSKDVVSALTPTPTPTPTTPGGTTTVAEDMAAKPLTAPVTPGTPTTGDAMFSGEMPGGNLSAAADVAKAMDPSVATSAVTTNAGNATNIANTAGQTANTASQAVNTASQATEAASGAAPTGGLGTIGGAIEGFGSGMAAGGVAGGVGGGIGGAIGGTVASPLAAAGGLANMAGLTGVGSTLTGAASTISGATATAGAELAALIMAF